MLQGSHLLVVDDERTTRLTLSEIFSLRGAIVSIAGSGEEALKLIEQTHFDLIILDIKMPGISGLEVLDSVHVSSPSTIVILLTAQDNESTLIRARELGAMCLLKYCITIDEICTCVRSKLAGRPRASVA